MKKLSLIVVVLLGLMGSAMAYEVEGNPDRKISIGFNYDYTGASTDYKFGITRINNFTKTSQNMFLGDIKIPVSPFFSFGVRGGFYKQETTGFTSEVFDSSGFDFGFGVRFFIS